MATTLEIGNFGQDLADVVSRVRAGEEITLVDQGEPVVRLVPLRGKRSAPEFGYFAGRVRISDDFDAPLPDDLLAEFEK